MSSNPSIKDRMFILTPRQLALMRRTVKGGRNQFETDLGRQPSSEFELLVDKGLATKENPPPYWMGDDIVYRLTKAGKQAIAEAD